MPSNLEPSVHLSHRYSIILYLYYEPKIIMRGERMKNTLICIAFLLLLPLFCRAESVYDIGDFHPTDLRQYSLSPNFYNTTEYTSLTNKHAHDRYYNALSLNGEFRRETPGYSCIIKPQISGMFEAYDSYYSQDTKDRETELTGILSAAYRKYDGLKFWGADYNNNFFTDDRKEHIYRPGDDNDTDYVIHSKYFKNQISLATGYGRQYECQDAYKAWYYLQALNQKGCLQRQVTAEDIGALTDVLYGIRSVNKVDSREEYILQSEALITHLQSTDYIKPGMQAKATSVLMELWQRGDDTIRLVGTKVELSAMGSVLNYRRKSTFDNIMRSDDPPLRYYEADTGVKMLFSYEKPLRNVFQLSSQISLMHGWADVFVDEETFPVNNTWKPFTQVEGKTGISYYPDCRMVYSADLYGRVLDNIYQDYTVYPYTTMIYPDRFGDLRIYNASLTLGAKYQFSPRLAINGILSGSYEYHKIYHVDFHQSRDINLQLDASYKIY